MNKDILKDHIEELAVKGWELFVDGEQVEPLTLDTYLAALGPEPLWRGTVIVKYIRWSKREWSNEVS